MPCPPGEIGYRSQYLRPSVQSIIDKIDCMFADPLWVSINNQASSTDPAGTLKYAIEFEGQLNDNEKTTILNGWTALGWTAAILKNNPVGPTDVPAFQTWILQLSYSP